MRILAVAGTLIACAVGTQAHAETAKSRTAAAQAAAEAFTVRGDFNAQAAAAQPNKILQWDTKKGRWGLKLDLGSKADQWKDVEAGAFFRITPSLRVGGALGLENTKDAPVTKRDQEEAAPKVRLEGAFKF
ncbi:MAG TPA: hypothetical protein VF138_04535 [Caulobacteraceae bacterium]